MLFNRQQLAMSLCQLVETDYELLNEIIIDYVNNLNDNEFDNVEDYVNNNINELMWNKLTRDYERIVNNNAGAIPANLINTNWFTIDRLCVIITVCCEGLPNHSKPAII